LLQQNIATNIFGPKSPANMQ